MGVTWSQGARVNRWFADASLPAREAAALKAFARRDPRSWVPLAINAVVLGAVLVWLYLQSPSRRDPHTALDAAMVSLTAFALFCGISYLWWELSLASRVRQAVGRKAPVGALLTSSFGPRALRVTTPHISYEIPYDSIARVARFGDVLLVKPVNHHVIALPMELVTARDYELIVAKVQRTASTVAARP